MARMPGQPTSEDGRPIVPSATEQHEDDVEGHMAMTMGSDLAKDDPRRAADDRQR